MKDVIGDLPGFLKRFHEPLCRYLCRIPSLQHLANVVRHAHHDEFGLFHGGDVHEAGR